ncbi:MAG: marine proteobacterial sortase target protein [Pseudomonadota bacterium]
MDKQQKKSAKSSEPRTFWHEVGELVIMFVVFLGLYFALLTVLASSAEANVSDDYIGLDEVQQGSLLFKTGDGHYRPAPALNTEVEIDVSGMVARAKVRQRFENRDDQWVEGVYVFPLPEDAAVDHMRMAIGERIIEGQIKERAEAKRTYEQAKAARQKAALIEQERPNLFTNSVANIGPRETVVVEIEYQQILRYDSGAFHLRFPMAITPRYIPGAPVRAEESVSHFDGHGWALNTDQVPDAARITPPVVSRETKINPVALTLHLNAGFPLAQLSSPTHAIQRTDRDAAHGITEITFRDKVFAERDFELSWAPVPSQAPRAALFSDQVGAERYHLLMVLPPDANQVQQTLAREVIYIIDTSGSMAGTSIEQARQALLLALQRLRPGDRFNVISFNSTTDQLFDHAVTADAQPLQQAQRYVSGLQADGGTEMMPALEAALLNQEESNAVRQVVFLTDGSVGNEDALFGLIDRKLGPSRLFTIGIGSAPNSHFMSKAAQFGRGTYTYIGDVAEVQSKMAALFAKLESPMMSDLRVDSGGAPLEIYPQRLPDLYQGEPLIITAKGAAEVQSVTISGQRQQHAWQSRIALQSDSQSKGVGVLWARRKIADLMDRQVQGGDPQQIREQVISVALQHHLVSKYTSLVAVDVTPVRPQNAALDTRALPVNLPQGQVHEKIFGRMPQTATAAPLHLMIGGMLLLLALMIYRRQPLQVRG